MSNSTQDTTTRPSTWRRFTKRHLAWFTLYVVTVLALLWWYELRPRWNAERNLQGAWQFTSGIAHDEHLEDAYFRVKGADAWLCFPRGSEWDARASRISLRPARDFFIVRRQYGFGGKKDTHETEYIVRLVDDRLYFIRGMAKLDGMRDRKIEKLYRIDELPPEVLQATEVE